MYRLFQVSPKNKIRIESSQDGNIDQSKMLLFVEHMICEHNWLLHNPISYFVVRKGTNEVEIHENKKVLFAPRPSILCTLIPYSSCIFYNFLITL